MVKYKIIVSNSKPLSVVTIDESESTPGQSRQYTRFNDECKPVLEHYLHIVGCLTPYFLDKIHMRYNFCIKDVSFDNKQHAMIVTLTSIE